VQSVSEAAVGAVIIANIIDFAASMVQIYSGVVKEKKKILFWQTLQLGMQTLSMILLGAFTGAVSNVVSVVRNVLCYKDRMNWPVKFVLIGIQLVLTVIFGNGTFVSWLPFIVCTFYILFMDEKDEVRFKFLVTLTFIPWVFYFFVYKSYTGAFFAAATIVTNCISLYQMVKKRKEEKAEQGL
jgi:hypothetical protein